VITLSRTHRYVLLAGAWLLVVPLLAVPLMLFGAFPQSTLHSTLVSAVWGLGLIAIFGAWTWQDAPAHGKSHWLAVACTAAWFLLFVLAVFPYLFATRGAKQGAIASLQFVCLLLAFGVIWIAVPRLFSLVF
jgi:nicotinamide riboside transporter PnuC